MTFRCTYHCGGCGRHFHSLEAFDKHRVGDHASNDPETRRRCVSPLDLDGEPLVPLTKDGICTIGGAVAEHDVVIWTHGAKLARARALRATRQPRRASTS